MSLSPHAYVKYDCKPVWDTLRGRWLSHGHLVPLGDGQVCMLGIEEAAQLLAEAVHACSSTRHEGHAYTHQPGEADQAYKDAVTQLIGLKDFDAEYAQQEWNKYLYQKWGGTRPVPAAVITPDELDHRQFNVIMPDRFGDPYIYPLRANALQEVLPPPEESNAVKTGLGWHARRRWSADRKLRHLLNKQS